MKMHKSPSTFAMSIAMLVVFTIVHTFVAAGGKIYTRYPGYRLVSPCKGSVHSGTTLSGCVARCSQVSTCVSGSHKDGQCCVSESLIYHAGVVFVQDAQSVYFQTKADVAWYPGNWALAFRASNGIGNNVYTDFLNVSRHDDYPVGGASASISCWSLSGSHSCSKHLKSSMLSSWNAGTLAVQKIKFSLFKNGSEVVNIVFDGAGTTLSNWFTASRILSASYTDVSSTQTYNVFSMLGMDAHVTRRFYVSRSHGGCSADSGWITVVEKAACSWDQPGTAYPYFLYSPLATYYTWDIATVGTADVLAIFVQL